MAAVKSQASESHLSDVNVHPSGAEFFHSTTSFSLQLVRPMSKIIIVKLEDGNFLTLKQQVLILSEDMVLKTLLLVIMLFLMNSP